MPAGLGWVSQRQGGPSFAGYSGDVLPLQFRAPQGGAPGPAALVPPDPLSLNPGWARWPVFKTTTRAPASVRRQECILGSRASHPMHVLRRTEGCPKLDWHPSAWPDFIHPWPISKSRNVPLSGRKTITIPTVPVTLPSSLRWGTPPLSCFRSTYRRMSQSERIHPPTLFPGPSFQHHRAGQAAHKRGRPLARE